MRLRAKLISGVGLLAVALAVWRFTSQPGDMPLVEAAQEAALRAAAPPDLVPTPAVQERPSPARSSQPQPAEAAAYTNALNERTLVGTKWERDGFAIEFGVDGKLLIGGRERAQWRVEGSRIRLYRDTTGEEHWLDIVKDKLTWEGQEIGRVP